jgi:hypothetical protein
MVISELYVLLAMCERAQFWRVDLGTTNRCGPAVSRYLRGARKEIVGVFPRGPGEWVRLCKMD